MDLSLCMTRLTAGISIGHLIAWGEESVSSSDADSYCMDAVRASDAAGG